MKELTALPARMLTVDDQGCEDRVIRKIRERREAGRQKYGTTMEREDLSMLDWLHHAQQEAMDLAIYLERLIRDLEGSEKVLRDCGLVD